MNICERKEFTNLQLWIQQIRNDGEQFKLFSHLQHQKSKLAHIYDHHEQNYEINRSRLEYCIQQLHSSHPFAQESEIRLELFTYKDRK